MSRPTIASIAGILFVILYIAAAVAIAVNLGRLNWAIEAAYWCIAGIVWVFPIRWLMLWSVGKR